MLLRCQIAECITTSSQNIKEFISICLFLLPNIIADILQSSNFSFKILTTFARTQFSWQINCYYYKLIFFKTKILQKSSFRQNSFIIIIYTKYLVLLRTEICLQPSKQFLQYSSLCCADILLIDESFFINL